MYFYCDTEEAEIYYKRVYFHAIDTIVPCIQDRFNQQVFRHVRTLKNFFQTH